MSRSDVLVDADWVEAHQGDPGVVLVEVDEDTSAYDKGTSPTPSRSTGRRICRTRCAATSWTRPVSRSCCRRAGSPTTTGDPVRREQQLVRRVRLLVLPAVRAPEREAARRRPQEVGARLPRPGQGGPGAAQDLLPRPRSRTPRSGPSATRWWPPSASATWWTCARPTSSPASCWPPRTCRRSRPSGPGTSRPRRTCPGPRRPTTTARSSPTTTCARCTRDEAGLDFAKDTIAYCRIGERSAHTWFVLHELLGQPNVKNYDGSWTEYGSLVGRADRAG